MSGASDSSNASTKPSAKAPAKIRWTFDGPLPETGGIGFDITWNQFVWPRTFQPADFSRVHFWDHGYRFTFLMPITHVDVTGPLGLSMPKLVFNRPYAVHTNWVSSIILHPIGNNLLVTCILLRPASRYSFGTSPSHMSRSLTHARGKPRGFCGVLLLRIVHVALDTLEYGTDSFHVAI